MPDPVQIDLSLGLVPEGFCPTTWQQTFQGLLNILSGSLPINIGTVNLGPNTPDADHRGFPWIRYQTDGSPYPGIPAIWTYFGSWLAAHPVLSTDKDVRLWKGTLGDLDTKDGGSAGAVTATTGPFWTRDTDFDGKMVVGVGTLQPSGTVKVLGDTGGVDRVTLDTTMIPSHSHPSENGNPFITQGAGMPSEFLVGGAMGANGEDHNVTGLTGGGLSHDNMPPYRCVYFIKRTARVYYSLPG